MNNISKTKSRIELSRMLLIIAVIGLFVFLGLYLHELAANNTLHKQLLNQSAAVDLLSGQSTAVVTTKVDLATGQVLPNTVKISKGTTLTWHNGDASTYTLQTTAGAPEQFTSKPLKAGDTFSRAFKTVGTYNYYVVEKPSTMAGTIIVTD